MRALVSICAVLAALCMLTAAGTRANEAAPGPEQAPEQLHEQVHEQAPEVAPERANQWRLPKLFDFNFYRERFGKQYSSASEEVARKTVYIANALRAYVSGMNYKWRRASYFLAVNHLSDLSAQELDRRLNRVQAAASREERASVRANASLSLQAQDEEKGEQEQEHEEGEEAPAGSGDPLPEFVAAEGEDVERELRELVAEHADGPGYRELLQEGKREGGNRRRRREAQLDEPREFSFELLMKPGVREQVSEPAEVQAKISHDEPSNNPSYVPLEVPTQGLNENHREVAGSAIRPVKKDSRPLGWQLKSVLGRLASRYSASLGLKSAKPLKGGATLQQPPNRMYFDHRDSGCLLTPRDQGDCGSCYAFAATTITEWLYCMKKGVLMPFSEQYMIDCGYKRFGDRMVGCDGATDYSVIKYIQNFGVERARSYPYRERDGTCPYDDSLELDQVGYIRMELDYYVAVPVSRWEEYIEHGPLYTGIAAPSDYAHYAGGVHDGSTCKDESNHAQVLVGHGREDGQDYWLLRNSYGPHWGDGGYFKLSKNAPKRCFDPHGGYALGSMNARNYTVEPKRNKANHELRKAVKEKRERERQLARSNAFRYQNSYQ